MDEVSMTFDSPDSRTVEEVGVEDVKIRTTGNEKAAFTLVLCVTADGGRLPPFVIFKRKTMPKEIFSKGIIVEMNEKGWNNSEMMLVWRRRAGGFFSKKSMLIIYAATSHRTE